MLLRQPCTLMEEEEEEEISLSFNGFYRVAVAVQRQRVIYTDYSGFASPALGSAHFVAIGFYFLSKTLI